MHVRCPQCQVPIELPSDGQLSDIPCPSCGSSFSLLGTSETIPYETGMKTIGHFELVERIGVGTFGFVWKARDADLDRTVAVKIPRKGQLDPAETEQFLREARAAAQLRHANIVSVHEVGRDQDTVFIVSDFVEGTTLADRLTAQRLSIRESADLCAKIAAALEHAHRLGVIHRDLKPGNVILDSAGEPHIMDFGLARREAGEVTMTVEGRVLGTPAYMSPEQAKGSAHAADRRSDVYSLGVILFEMLTGERPFRGNVRMLIHQVINEEPPNPRRLNGNVPRDLETICLKCLQKEPSKRYESAGSLADDLQRFLDGQPIQARPVSLAQRAWRWCRRNRAAALALLLGLMVAISAVVFPVVLYHREKGYSLALDTSLQDSRRQSAVLALEKALVLCEQNEVARGLIHLGEALQLAIDANDQELERVVRLNMGAWSREAHQLTHVLRHPAPVRELDVSLDGRLLATACDDGMVRFWNPQSGELVGDALSHEAPAGWVVFHPDGKRILTGCGDGKIRFWSVDDRSILEPVLEHAAASMDDQDPPELVHVELSRSGQAVATAASDGSVRIWEVSSGNLRCPQIDLGTRLSREKSCIEFSPDETTLLIGGWGALTVWSTETGQKIRRLEGDAFRVVFATAFHPSGNTVLLGETLTGRARQWDAGLTTPTMSLPTYGDLTTAAYSSDGRLLATGSTNGVGIWNVATERPIGLPIPQRIAQHGLPTSVRFLPDGLSVAVASESGEASIWKLASTSHRSQVENGIGYWVHARFMPNGRSLLVGGPSGLAVVTVTSDNRAHELEVILPRKNGYTEIPLIGPQGDTVYGTLGTRVLRFDRNAGIWLTPIETGLELLRGATLSRDGSTLAAWDSSTVSLWNAHSGEPLAQHIAVGELWRGACFSPDGQTLVTGDMSGAGNIQLWDVRTGRPVKSFAAGEQIHYLAMAPCGTKVAIGFRNGNASLLDLETGVPVARVMQHKSEVLQLSVSEDGKWVLTASRDCTARVWDLATGWPVGPPLRHDAVVWSIECSPNAEHAVSCDMLGANNVWDMPRPVSDAPDVVALCASTITNLRIDERGTVRILEGVTWEKYRDEYFSRVKHKAQ